MSCTDHMPCSRRLFWLQAFQVCSLPRVFCLNCIYGPAAVCFSLSKALCLAGQPQTRRRALPPCLPSPSRQARSWLRQQRRNTRTWELMPPLRRTTGPCSAWRPAARRWRAGAACRSTCFWRARCCCRRWVRTRMSLHHCLSSYFPVRLCFSGTSSGADLTYLCNCLGLAALPCFS